MDELSLYSLEQHVVWLVQFTFTFLKLSRVQGKYWTLRTENLNLLP